MGKKEIFYIIATALLFSTMEVALKICGSELDAFQITFLRFAIGGLFLLPFAVRDIRKRNLKFRYTDWLYLAGLGILCICISMLLFQIAIDHANASLISVIICTNPLFVMIFSHFILHDRFTGTRAIVLVISFSGLFIAANPFSLTSGNTPFGIICGILASITFGLYSTLGKIHIARIGDLTQTCMSFLIGSAFMLIPMNIMGLPVIRGISLTNIPLLLYLGIMVTGIGYYFFFEAVHASGPSSASLVFFLKPMFAPFVAMLVLHEEIHLNMIVGIILLLTGSFINIRSTRISQSNKNNNNNTGRTI